MRCFHYFIELNTNVMCIHIAVEAAIWLIASHRIASLFISSINLKEDTNKFIYIQIDRHTHTYTCMVSHILIRAYMLRCVFNMSVCNNNKNNSNNNAHQWHWVSSYSVYYSLHTVWYRKTHNFCRSNEEKEKRETKKIVNACVRTNTSVQVVPQFAVCVILSVSYFTFLRRSIAVAAAAVCTSRMGNSTVVNSYWS